MDNESITEPAPGPLYLRVSPHSYFFAFFIEVFAAAFLIYLEYEAAAAFVLLICIPLTIFSGVRDRYVFDGTRIRRTGFLPGRWARMNRSRDRLKIADIERVETTAERSIRRGSRIIYSYRTRIMGKGAVFTLISGGVKYRRMVRAILSRLPESVMDNRSIELRDYLTDPKEARLKAAFSDIPPADVLESAAKMHSVGAKAAEAEPETGDIEKADHLRRLANELRLAGSLLQALETFRRAARIKPKDAWLLFEFARCLQSFALSERDPKMGRKAAALMRLSEKRAGNDLELLSRLGENYFQIGEWKRAGRVFERAIVKFRSMRGLAEIALREGKLAHVVHNFSAANRIAETPALRRWTSGEVEYFSRLSENDEYMEMELSRLSLHDSLGSIRASAMRLAVLGFPVITVGLLFDDKLAANIGWAVSGLSLIVFTAVSVFRRMLADRIPFELIEED